MSEELGRDALSVKGNPDRLMRRGPLLRALHLTLLLPCAACVGYVEAEPELGVADGGWVLDAARPIPDEDAAPDLGAAGGCEGIPVAANVGKPCLTDTQCGAGARCLPGADGEARCHQNCVPDSCVERCVSAADCRPLLDGDGTPHLEGGVAVGYCATARGCRDIMGCVYGCQDADCQAGCYEGAGQAELQRASALISCLNREAAACAGDDACLAAACAEHWSCMPDQGSPPDPDAGVIAPPDPDAGVVEPPDPDVGVVEPPPGSVDCQPAWACGLACGDAACQRGCLAGQPEGVEAALAALYDCAAAQPSWRHAADACPEAWSRCQMPSTGHTDCATTYQCVGECEGVLCEIECVLAARPDAVEQLDGLMGCFERSGVETLEQAVTRCPGEWSTCGLPEIRVDGMSCQGAMYCIIECGNEGDCQQACIEGSTTQAERGVMAIFNCAEQIGAQTYNEIGNQCADWGACGMPQPRNTGCADLFMALNGGGCPDDRCRTDAVIHTTLDGINRYQAIIACMNAAFPDGGALTAQQLIAACPNEWGACGL